MSERVVRTLDFRTGEVIEHVTYTDAASLEERFEGVAASAREHLPGDVLAHYLAVRCDGCGLVQPVDRPELPADWITTIEGEFCPRCLAAP